MSNNVDLIVDMQYGSTGKGLLAGYLAKAKGYDVVVNANMPNAGHTFIDEVGNKFVNKVLPNGVVSPNLRFALIGPGSVFSWDQLVKEIHEHRNAGYMTGATVVIHDMAVPLQEAHIKLEEESNLTNIGSTKQGSVAALMHKMTRDPGDRLVARDVLPVTTMVNGVTVVTADPQEYRDFLLGARHGILAEGAQGFSLGINEQFYPYCTSRNCDPGRFLSDMGIPIHMLDKAYGTCRTFPIRVGGTSGGCYPDQQETSWEALGLGPEFTTVTGRERRVFTWSWQQFEESIVAMSVDHIFLNFVNYLRFETDEFIYKVRQKAKECGAELTYIGTGASYNDVHRV